MKKIKDITIQLLIVALGNIIYAIGVSLFILPGNLITGGTTGIALFINHVFGMEVSLFVLIFNTAMFLLGMCVFGVKFAATTAVCTFTYPIALHFLQPYVSNIVVTEDPMLCTIFAGACVGLSLGIVIRSGAATGGMDIPPLILRKYFKIPVSVAMYSFDVIILLLQATFHDLEDILYGIVLIVIYTMILDKCLMIGSNKIEIKIVSKESEKIQQTILQDIDRGVTLLNAKTGYLQDETELVLSVVSSREASRTCKLIHQIDPNAFLIISKVSEVRGRGFTNPKHYQ